MVRLCQWLGLEFHESLLHSTFNGLAWVGNASDRRFAQGFDPRFTDKWRETLPAGDAEFVSMLDYAAMKYFRYVETPARSGEDLNGFLAGTILSSLSSHGSLRRTFLRYHCQAIKAAFIPFASPLQFRDSKAKYLRKIAGRLAGLGRQINASLREMGRYGRFRDQDLPGMFRKLREQHAYLESRCLPDNEFLTGQSMHQLAEFNDSYPSRSRNQT